MKKQMVKYIGFVIGVCAVFFTGQVSVVRAATEFMTSWQTKTYVPAWYEGKAFPTYQSVITVAFELVEDGKIVDLSKNAVRWYVDGKMLKNETSGMGIKRIVVFNKKYGGDVSSVKITLPSYKGKVVETLIDIPIKNSEVVIDAPYFQKKVPKGESTMYAWPFFFNTTSAGNLSLQWTVDGVDFTTKSASDPSLLFTVGNEIPTGAKSVIEATVINQRKAIENITKKVFVEML